uniref:Uncharacterized protein n=1 Tax=Rhizophora mucronata TaxID=61149 RepID=A0A2P2QIH6_RHIMU
MHGIGVNSFSGSLAVLACTKHSISNICYSC